ncbi:MAG: FMN-binding protein [Bacteroidaceae bacterium]|nr:FMN-binding protein [Bacteroidaceae bacterium]
MNTNSNVYTIVYASVMVIIVAFLLAFVASSLKETQDANVARDVKGQILSSVNLRGEADVDGKYAEVITENENGTFTANINGEEKLIVPLKGAGLWGPIWGYISVNKDGETVYGAFFNHEGETAGLGARIVEEWFQTGFNGKKIFKDNEVALGVYKAGKAPSNLSADYVVDAVTGATLTSDGVRNMIQKCIAQYADAINAFKGGESKSCNAKPCCGEEQCEKADSCCVDSCADCASSCDECGACKAEKECGACCESDKTNK